MPQTTLVSDSLHICTAIYIILAFTVQTAGQNWQNFIREPIGTLVPWYPGTLIPWYPGTLVPWYPGTLGERLDSLIPRGTLSKVIYIFT